jgi:hypothetical protein
MPKKTDQAKSKTMAATNALFQAKNRKKKAP